MNVRKKADPSDKPRNSRAKAGADKRAASVPPAPPAPRAALEALRQRLQRKFH